MSDKKHKSEYLLKITIIGSPSKLKDQFVDNYADGKFNRDYIPPTTAQICTKKVKVGKTQVKLILVYTITKPLDYRMVTAIYRGASAGIIIFDKSDRKSFDDVPDWLEEFRKNIPNPHIPIAILGINTKEEDVTSDEGNALVKLLDLTYFETSSPKFENSHEIFEYLARKVIYSKSRSN